MFDENISTEQLTYNENRTRCSFNWRTQLFPPRRCIIFGCQMLSMCHKNYPIVIQRYSKPLHSVLELHWGLGGFSKLWKLYETLHSLTYQLFSSCIPALWESGFIKPHVKCQLEGRNQDTWHHSMFDMKTRFKKESYSIPWLHVYPVAYVRSKAVLPKRMVFLFILRCTFHQSKKHFGPH